jgi:hypothetical protein
MSERLLALQVTKAEGIWWDRIVQAIQEGLAPVGSDGRPLAAPLPVLPCLLMGRTDSANFAHLSDGGVLRFLPIPLNRTAGEIGLVHGINERISVAQFLGAARYYVQVMQLMTSS